MKDHWENDEKMMRENTREPVVSFLILPGVYSNYVQEKIRYVKSLLDAGADVNAFDGEAFLVAARLPNHTELVELLLEQPDIAPNKRNFYAAFDHVARTSDSPKIVGRFAEVLHAGNNE
jgi:hypothetical protein